MSLQKTWSNESINQLQPLSRPAQDLTRPRKHARRTSLPVPNREATSGSTVGGSLGLGGVDTSNYNAERRKFREAIGKGSRGSSAASRRRESAPSGSNKAIRNSIGKASFQVEVDEGDDEDEGTDDINSAINSSTTYAAGPSGAGRASDDLSSSDASSSDRHAFDWDIAKKRNSAPNTTETLTSQQQKYLLSVEPPHSTKLKRRSFQGNGSKESSLPDTPTLTKRELDPGLEPSGATLGVIRSITNRNSGNGSPSGTSRFSPTGAEAVGGIATRRVVKPQKRDLFASPSLETFMIISAGLFACYRLHENEEEAVYRHVYELASIVCTSALYCILRSPTENGAIWATDERNYRPCGDDGAICGLLLGPLLAVTCLFTSLDDKIDSRPASGDSLAFPPWRIEGPQSVLGSRTTPHPKFSALTLSRLSLLSLQTLTATTLLCHLLATKWIRKPSAFPKSNWKRLWSFIKFSTFLSILLAAAREAFVAIRIPIWTDLTRGELVVSTLFFQCNLYTISRLARKSFTLGELGIVATVGVTLSIEALNLTTARLLPGTTLYVKTFRRPTPLLVFQLALVVGTFMIGFLLSPLLYLSRHLAQKPVHRLRWPHKRDLHRRLLAGFFYFFAALFVVGVLGFWVWWLLGRRNPWLWTIHFVLEGKYRWSRPLLITYWLALVSISIAGWQATVLGGKRIRIRTAGVTANGQQKTVSSSRLSSNDPAESTSKNGNGQVMTNNGEVNTSNTPLAFTKKAAYLSLNARRKFFHALAVLLFLPGIAYDPAFSHLAFSLAFSAFIMAEYIRYYALYPFGAVLHVFMSEFTDHKDSGPVILSHFYLLTGCASTVWIEGVRSGNTHAKVDSHWLWGSDRGPRYGPESTSNVDISMFIGVLTLGVGDALASIIGRRYGRIRWPKSSKTIEGSVAFVTSIFASALFLRLTGWCAPFPLFRFGLVTIILGILEGASNQNDNLVLPVFGFVALSLFHI